MRSYDNRSWDSFYYGRLVRAVPDIEIYEKKNEIVCFLRVTQVEAMQGVVGLCSGG
jgi:hypothetical protein